MSANKATQSRWTMPLMAVVLPCLVRFLPCATGDDRQPMRLLPRRRLSTAILPIVGGATRAAGSGHDLGGGIRGELLGVGHGQILPPKKKSAMPKIILDKLPVLVQITPVAGVVAQNTQNTRSAGYSDGDEGPVNFRGETGEKPAFGYDYFENSAPNASHRHQRTGGQIHDSRRKAGIFAAPRPQRCRRTGGFGQAVCAGLGPMGKSPRGGTHGSAWAPDSGGMLPPLVALHEVGHFCRKALATHGIASTTTAPRRRNLARGSSCLHESNSFIQ